MQLHLPRACSTSPGARCRSATAGARRLAALALALVCLLCAAASRAADPADKPVADSLALARALKVSRSPSGRFAVIGSDSGENVTVGRWADDVLSRFEGQTGLRCATSRARAIVITIAPPETNAVAGAEVDVRGRRLVVREPFNMDRGLADVVLCGCLFDSCIVGYQEERRGDGGEAAESAIPPLPPPWLVTGLARSLSADIRANDAAIVFKSWRSASLPTVADCLAVEEGLADETMRCCWGFLVASLLRHKDGKDMMSAAVTSVAEGRQPGISLLLDGVFEWRDVADVEEWWDAMVLKQARVVRRPGHMTDEDRKRFEAALLLYPGSFGMPLSHALYEPVTWAELIDARKEPWVADFCRRKEFSLRMLAAGRGEFLQETAEAYAGLLQYLARGKSEKHLRRKLDEAEASLSALRAAPGE